MTSPSNRGAPASTEPRINDRIRVPEVRLVGPNGEQVGIVRIEDALRLAQEADLDLVEVAAQARPPVCKLMDYGKFKYESAQKARESRRNQQLTVIKELGYRLLQRLAEDVAELGFVESNPKQDGRNMIMVLAPHKTTKTRPIKHDGADEATAESVEE
jgi:translation initiation factor IF-3